MSIIRDLDKVKKEETEKLLDRQKKLVSIPKWTDGERPANYLWKFEQAMTCNKEPKIRWAELLPLYLTGNASTVYTSRVSADVKNDYKAIKTILLDSFGDTVQQARKDWWTLRKLQGESPEELVIRIEGKIKRGLDGCDSIMDATAMITLSRFLSILPSDVSTFVLGRNPKSAMEAAHMASEFQALHSWKAKPTYSSRYDRRDENPSYRSDRSEGRKDARSSALGTARGGGQNRQQQGFSERNKTRTESNSNNSERPITCYGCGEKGHKRPDCPKRVRRVRSPQPKHAFMVQGKIGEIECKKMVLDSGSDITIINSKLITDDQLTGETVTVHTVDDRPIHFPLARVCLNVGNYSIHHVVAVSHTIKDDALLGVDLENFRDLMRLGVCQEMEKATPIRVQQTRKQVAEQGEQERLDDIATAQSGATLVDLSEVPDLDDSLFQREEERQVQATPDAEEDILQLPLPKTVAEDPLEEGDDRTLLMEQQKKDESLTMVTRMADRNENGYKYEEGLVVHIEVDELGTAWTRVVMPKCRCQSILALAHSNPMGGHFGVKRTIARVRKHFTWPGLSVDIKSLCTSCPQCQKAARNDHSRAP